MTTGYRPEDDREPVDAPEPPQPPMPLDGNMTNLQAMLGAVLRQHAGMVLSHNAMQRVSEELMTSGLVREDVCGRQSTVPWTGYYGKYQGSVKEASDTVAKAMLVWQDRLVREKERAAQHQKDISDGYADSM